MRLLIFTFLLVFGTLYPQDHIKDSLKTVLEETLNSNADSLSISRAYFKLGKHLSYTHVSESYQYLEKSLEIAEKLKHDRAIAVNLNIIASNYSDESRHLEAIEMYKRSHETFLKMNEPSKAADVLMNVATSYLDLGDYETALKYELDALELKIFSKDSVNIANYYTEIGIVYDLLDNSAKHKEYILKAKELSKNSYYSDFYTTQKVLNELGEVLVNEKEYNKALRVHEEVYSLAKKENYLRGMSTSLTNRTDILIKLGKVDKALKLALEAHSLNQKIGNEYKLFCSGNRLAELYVLKKNYSLAKKYLDNSISAYSSKGYPAELQRSYLIYYKLYKAKKKSSAALGYFEKYEELKDSLRSMDINSKILEMDTKFKTVEKDKKIALLNKDKEIQTAKIEQQQIMIISIIILIILSLIAVYFIYKRKKEKYLLAKTASELKMLRAQLNPHFIFNSLGAIQNYILNKDNIVAADYLADFSKLMRLILDSSRSETILLSDEIKLMEKYLNLQKLRFTNSFEYKISNSISKDYEIPPMLTQPFIENAIEHGVSIYQNNEGEININLQEDKNTLIIEIEDNGPGITNSVSDQNNGHRSHAMKIISERISNLNKQNKFKVDFTLTDSADDLNKGTKITFKINLN